MNLSGKSVAALARFFKIAPPDRSWSLTTSSTCCPAGQDEARRQPCRPQRPEGHPRPARHADYWRLRLGIGHPGVKAEVVNYVLKKPSAEHREAIERPSRSRSRRSTCCWPATWTRDDEDPRRRAPSPAPGDCAMKPWIAALLPLWSTPRRVGRAGVPLRRRTLFADALPGRRGGRNHRPAQRRGNAPKRGAWPEERRKGGAMERERRRPRRRGAAPAIASLGPQTAASEPARPNLQPKGKPQGQEGQGLARLHRRRAEAGALKLARLTAAACACSRRYFSHSVSLVSTCAGSTGMQLTGQTCTHCGSSKWPTHSVQRSGRSGRSRAHRDRLVGALGLADIAVDALVGDQQGHRRTSAFGRFHAVTQPLEHRG